MHEQHTYKFIRELNAPNKNKKPAIDHLSNTWNYGKYRGRHITEIPSTYLKWGLKNIKSLTIKDKELITQLIKK